MDRKRVSDRELADLGEFQGTIDRNSNFREQALNHNLGRNVRVVKVLTYLAKMVQDGCRLLGTVDCVAARRQNFSSSRTRTQMGLPAPLSQAAHFVPGQIRIGGRNVWELASDSSTRAGLEFVFAEVEHLPIAFNQADSAAENKGEACGLAAAFAAACTELIKQSDWRQLPGNLGAVPHPHSPAGKMVNWASAGLPHPAAPAARGFDWSLSGVPHPDSPSGSSFESGGFLKTSGGRGNLPVMAPVYAGFGVWQSGAIAALNQALRAKRDKPGLPPLVGNPFDGYTPESIEARSTADSSTWNRDEAVSILEYYIQDQQQRTPAWVHSICARLLTEL